MPLVSIREARSWHKMRYPVFGQRGTVMLATATPLTVALAKRLADLDFRWVHVCDREMPDEALKPFMPNELRGHALQVLETAFNAMRDAYHVRLDSLEQERLRSVSLAYVRERFLRYEQPLQVREMILQTDILDLAYKIGDVAIAADAPAALPFGSNRNPRTFLCAHSVDTALTSGVLAKDFGYERDEVARVVLGALLHDVGCLPFPAHWFFGGQPEAGPGEQALARTRRLHPVLGYLMLKEQRAVGLLAAHVAYQHHEHQDGSGFPRGIKGPNQMLTRDQALRASSRLIHRYANIVAAANAFDHLTAAPPAGFGLPPQEAAARLQAAGGTRLNRAVVSGLLAALPPFPLGSEVWLRGGERDGFRGVVARLPRRHINRPIVRVTFNREGKRIRPVDIDTASEPVGLSAEPPAGSQVGSANG